MYYAITFRFFIILLTTTLIHAQTPVTNSTAPPAPPTPPNEPQYCGPSCYLPVIVFAILITTLLILCSYYSCKYQNRQSQLNTRNTNSSLPVYSVVDTGTLRIASAVLSRPVVAVSTLPPPPDYVSDASVDTSATAREGDGVVVGSVIVPLHEFAPDGEQDTLPGYG
jgi:hypothetical protein